MDRTATTEYPTVTVTVRELLDHINSLWNAEVTEASAHEIAISVRVLTDQCNARYLKNIQVDGIYTPTNVFPTEIKSWYISDLNFTNIQKYIVDTFSNLEKNSYSTQIETSNRCIDILCVLINYLNLVIFSRLAHCIKLRQKKLDELDSSNPNETSILVNGDDYG